jgi:FtsP/CotA-like multicopper oxidase with cupredoxin domain
MVLSDIALEEDGELQPPESAGPARLAFGLEGNIVLVNGRRRPTLNARDGAPQRWRIVNAAKTRYFRLDFVPEAGATPFTLIGRDGGLQEHPTYHEMIVVAPGERVDVIVTPSGSPGGEILVRTLPYNRGYGSEYLPIEDLFMIRLADLPALEPSVLPAITRSIEPIDPVGATPVKLDITLVQLYDGGIEYRVNDTPMAKLKPVKAQVGETQIWTVSNPTKWNHPMHLHGFFFQVLDESGAPLRPLAWRDTVDVPSEQTVRFIVRFDDRPGMWMYHCHILDHAEGGIMGMVQVGDYVPQHGGHVHPKTDY